MGIKSTMCLGRTEALKMIARKLGADTDFDLDRQIEFLLEHVFDYNSEESEYYFNNFAVFETPDDKKQE